MFQLLRRAVLFSGIAVSAFLVGCAGPAPNYAPSIDNVEALKKIEGATAVKTGAIGVTAGMPGAASLSLRANTMTSPVGSNYGDYIAAALRQELELAKLHNPQSGVEISGTLLKNNIDAGGISTNAGQIEARFVVTANGQVRFDKVKQVERKWESSFAGAVAIPLAANNYPLMVQSLVGALVTDPDFIKAIRK
ncbi:MULTISPECIES: hypothetical protein [unclassified Polaromonas]|uniref:hypothetical protein n=1 Tax=unclassified Polaromonas TaxID=2638319 RepID=UPI000F086E51|nr:MULTISPECIES: hypothetical protein [unclassified Polaromonas]AYQ28268.1 hypothetical protein DT070_09720 [Polaromonas sp. SP1]QGJ20611.1 hypothetical protein F7R28_20905 [Polaromonas sp. Pch-P]